jgi:hypothetical protein
MARIRKIAGTRKGRRQGRRGTTDAATETGKVLTFVLEHQRRGCDGKRLRDGWTADGGYRVTCGACEDANERDHSVVFDLSLVDWDQVTGFVRVGLILNRDLVFTDEHWAQLTGVNGLMALQEFLDVAAPDGRGAPRRPN